MSDQLNPRCHSAPRPGSKSLITSPSVTVISNHLSVYSWEETRFSEDCGCGGWCYDMRTLLRNRIYKLRIPSSSLSLGIITGQMRRFQEQMALRQWCSSQTLHHRSLHDLLCFNMCVHTRKLFLQEDRKLVSCTYVMKDVWTVVKNAQAFIKHCRITAC